MSSVVFVCAGNAARSQFAEVIYREAYGLSVQSAGTEAIVDKPMPIDVLTVLKSRQLPATGLYRKQLTAEMVRQAQTVIVMTNQSLPLFLQEAKRLIHWNVADPRGQGVDAHHQSFMDIKTLIEKEFGANA